ncbi:MAG: SDR family NAD(P)-dependent oxidoreductase [Clostridiales bacterium]|nr:SDR family NAD(P)-dependent oxidoreductase [Clostridiales bacterium]
MKIAVITGASSGLGAEFVRRLAAEKELEEIWLIARREERLKALAAETVSAARLRPLPLDLTQEADLDAYAKRLQAEQPEIRWLVNAAGFGKMGTNEEIGRAALDQMLLLNGKAAMDMTELSMPYLTRGSHVLEICSTAAFMPLGGLGVYSASKAFLLSYSRTLHYEVRNRGIVVTAVCPYWVKDTEFISVARNTENPAAVRHFPLASKTRTVVSWALTDARLGFSVSTPGPVCTLHRLVCKLIPRDLLMLAWAGLRRL